MQVPNLIGLKLDQGLTLLNDDFNSLNIVINEDAIPDDFYKKNLTLGVKRIVRQRIIGNGSIELVVYTFNEIPHPL